MEKYKQIFITLMVFLIGFVISSVLTEFSTYLLNQPNTIANFFGSIILISTFSLILFFAYKFVKSFNK
jgi:hypothetical protein